MNMYKQTLVAGAVALAFACGGAFAQSSGGGGNAGGSSSQGQSGQGRNGAQGTMGTRGANGQGAAMNGAGMNGSTQGCANQATTTANRVAEPNRPPGTPVQGGTNKGSGDWSNQSSSCMNGHGHGNAGRSGAGRTPRNGGG